MELPLGCSYGQGRYTYEADASTAHEPEAPAGAGDLRPARVGVPEEKYKRNALRHSFGSYRMEMVKNAGQVALENGKQRRSRVEALLRHRGGEGGEGVLEYSASQKAK
jgi:hypothetical protein